MFWIGFFLVAMYLSGFAMMIGIDMFYRKRGDE